MEIVIYILILSEQKTVTYLLLLDFLRCTYVAVLFALCSDQGHIKTQKTDKTRDSQI